ncbi:MAG: BamA/TamA family outer membrane protein, partial [candidate division KSB1 bacterium]|nr:BamA/TamA family outer membrane protein [candidate division KSB1 bacterium]
MRFKILLVSLLFLFSSPLEAQYFGKNKVQYTNFKWQYVQSEHFDVYFTQGGEEIAEFVADVAEKSYRSIKEDLRYDLTDRISIILYNSHNDFEQTNVDLSPPEESVGGFTEFLKNRAVVPFDGQWEKLRHVVHHELTHAVMLQMVYGAGVQSILVGMARLQLPMWLIEGLAEYESRRWDIESDMFMRDATLNEYVPSIDRIGGFMAYKGGQSILYYLAEKYGREKIGELLGKIKINRSVEKGLKQSIGVDEKELTERWHLYLKREYWPDIAGRKQPEEFAKRLTDHKKYNNFVNNSPALSPKGDKIAFLSDKSDYFDIYVMSAIDGRILDRVVKGQRTGDLEELHWLRPGISWSPDSKMIAFAAKAGEEDALHLVDVQERNIVRSLKFGLDGVFSPAWSPKGDEIAFVGIKNGRSDLYAVNLETGKLRQITDDIFSDLEPSWSPDGKRLVFVSDRGEHTDPSQLPANFKILDIDFQNLDIYTVASQGGDIQRITETPTSERTPVYHPQGDKIAFTSERCGISNIYIRDLHTGVEYPITNVLTGIFHLSWAGDGSKLAFVSFYNGGYDIYLLKNPLAIKPGDVTPEKTQFMTKLEAQREKEASRSRDLNPLTRLESGKELQTEKYRNYIFGEAFIKGQVDTSLEEKKTVFLDSSEYKLASGEYKIHNYKIKFSPDIVYGNAGYSQFFGLQGTMLLSFSDVLGNHRINLYMDQFYDFRSSNYLFTYFYLPKRVDVGVGAFHYAYFFLTSWDWVRDRNYGAILYLSRPFSRYKRVDLGLTWLAIDREYLGIPMEFVTFFGMPTKRRVLLSSLSLVNDTVLWGYTGPVNGSRSYFEITYSPGYSQYSLDFITLRGDWRKYYKLKNEYNLVVRLSGGVSEGKQPQKFFLGGVDNWLNYRTATGELLVDDPSDIYFSTFETPLRGADYYEQVGDRFMLANLEFRFPLIKYFLMGWPLPIGLQNIRGALFTDIGGAWDKKMGEKFQP